MPASLRPTVLRCEYHAAPQGLERADPRFCWQLEAIERGAVQTAWQLQVAVADSGFDGSLVWDSGQVDGTDQLHIRYAGEALRAHGRYLWRVRVWDGAGVVSDWSEVAAFAMGVLNPEEWKQAQWIRHFQSNLRTVPQLRRDFTVSGPVADARLYLTAHGVTTLRINGRPVCDHRLLPGWTDYSVRLPSHCLVVTDLLREGANAIGAELADGWYRAPMSWDRKAKIWGNDLELLAMLRIEMGDGSVQWVCSDEAWSSAPGPTLSACLFDGEQFDANLVMPGWSEPAFTSPKRWYPVRARAVGDELIQRHPGDPVRVIEAFKPVQRWQPGPGRWIFDVGQNFAGIARLRVQVPAGTVLRLRFAEVLTPDRELYVDNLRTALATDYYIAAGTGVEVWEPQFTFHGFQFVELSGLPGEPDDETVTGLAFSSDCPLAGELRCSQAMVEKLASNAVWTQRANYIDVPTDCPQRDERLGWTGDAQAYIRTAIAFHDVAAFHTKWLQDLEDACPPDGRSPAVAPQGNTREDKLMVGYAEAAWGDATTICPMAIARCYGDHEVIERHYGMMTRYVGFYRRTCVSGRKVRYGLPKDILPDGSAVTYPTLFGDWLAVDAHTPHEIIRTAFYAQSVRLCRDAARLLAREDEAAAYEDEWRAIRTDFQAEFVREDGRIIGRSKAVDSQTTYCLALHFDLLDDEQIPAAVAHLVADIHAHDDHLTTGFVGLPYLLPVLSRFGHTELCYTLLLKQTYPSWGYEIAHGATSIWERWNGYHHEKGPGDPNMNSYAHYAYGAVCEWLFSDMAGIELLEEAFARIRIRPRIGGGLTHAGATYRSIRGPIRSDWRVDGDTLHLEVALPGNTRAEIHLPTTDAASVREGAEPVATTESVEAGYRMVEVGAGSWSFSCRAT